MSIYAAIFNVFGTYDILLALDLTTSMSEVIANVDALGRPVFLGQLYNRRTDSLIVSPPCWGPDALKDNIKSESKPSHESEYKEITSLDDRSKLLSISGSLTVGIMSGAISLSGSGSYLDTKKEKLSSREISAFCKSQTRVDRLTLEGGSLKQTDFDAYNAIGATHVVTEIIYGGCVIASFKLKSLATDEKTEVKGEFSFSAMKGLGDKLSIEATASIKSEATKTANDMNIAFNLHADAMVKKTPTTIAEALEIVKNWGTYIDNKNCVPLLFTLSPIAQFVDGSPEAVVLHELSQANLNAVIRAYDKLITLDGRRAALTEELLARASIFPTLCGRSEQLHRDLSQTVITQRENLAEYIKNYRAGGAKAGTTEAFITAVNEALKKHSTKYEDDLKIFKTLRTAEFSAKKEGAPFVDLAQLRSKMASVDGALGLIIIPEKPHAPSLNAIFRILLGKIKEWRATEDDTLSKAIKNTTDPRARRGVEDASFKTEFVTFYLDSIIKDSLLTVDVEGESSIKVALTESEKTLEPQFLYYDFRAENGVVLDSIEWNCLGRTGWSFLRNEDQGTSYTGEVKDGVYHGDGKIVYADNSEYSGRWWAGKRHGKGEGNDGNGVYINDRFDNVGVLLGIRSYSNGRIVAYREVPFSKYNAAQAHIKCMAEMFGWTPGAKHLVMVYSDTNPPEFESQTFRTLGSYLEDGKLEAVRWPLTSASIAVKVESMS